MYVQAAGLALSLAFWGILLSLAAGLVCSLIKYFKVPVLQKIVSGYIELSRNTPLLVQLFLLYFGLPKLGIVISSSGCAVIGLTFLGGSYMPVTALSSVVAFLSTAGIPPFAGFWSKLLIIMALWTTGNRVLAGCALCASILTSAYFLRLQKKVFFGPLPEHLSSVVEIKGSIKFIEILLTAVTTVVGLLFPLILVYLQSRGWI